MGLRRILSAAILCVVTAVGIAQNPERKPMVVVISLDAFGAALLAQPLTPVPTLHSLMKSGSYARSMQPVNPTVTWPNHTSIVTGVTAAKHGLIANGQITGQRSGKVPKPRCFAPPCFFAHHFGFSSADMSRAVCRQEMKRLSTTPGTLPEWK